ncbi:MAG: glycine cleavage system aminomethyltransferase GcvT [Chromatiaceae bacterium]|nr:MAG: glycine cleavage system aminomethyltransferase GcvT [Chromatiaceae bacterium]
MAARTPLYGEHLRLGARIVPFGGWDMPLHYGSQLDEHHAVRTAAGMFDVSHMRSVDVVGSDATALLRYLLANDVGRLHQSGQALYSCMLNGHAGIIDDLICYRRRDDAYRLVVNAASTHKDVTWIERHASGRFVRITRRDDLAMIAIQGPQARALTAPLLPAPLAEAAMTLASFHAAEHADWLVARTGYTGEDGLEVILPGSAALDLWQRLLAAGVRPCGLGARDTLRLEAGLNLYGQDMDEDQDPLASGLGWTVAWEPADRDFIGRAALESRRAATDGPRQIGLLLTGRGILRPHQPVLVHGEAAGEVTSGGFAPTLGRSIALARVNADLGSECEVLIRDLAIPARVVKPPFVRQGQARIAL